MPIYLPVPIVDQTIWGSNRLNKLRYNRDEIGGTSWEISFHDYGSNALVNAEGTLRDHLEDNPEAMIGSIDPKRLLRLCYLAAKEWLSIQLHPNHEYASRENIGDNGKYEAWFIIEADKNATLKAGTHIKSLEQLKASIEDGSIVEQMIDHPVKAGDFIYIPAGTLHALGAGIVAIEVGTNSNTTYRVYDYGRTNDQGQPRELHVQQVLETVDLSLKPQVVSVEPLVNEIQILTENDQFTVAYLEFEGVLEFGLMGSPLYLTILEGEITINDMGVKTFDNLFVSSDVQTLLIEGKGRLLISYTTEFD